MEIFINGLDIRNVLKKYKMVYEFIYVIDDF